ncbi:MAG: hypothetical protein ACI9IL_000625 [Rickettsiales bacterium]
MRVINTENLNGLDISRNESLANFKNLIAELQRVGMNQGQEIGILGLGNSDCENLTFKNGNIIECDKKDDSAPPTTLLIGADVLTVGAVGAFVYCCNKNT